MTDEQITTCAKCSEPAEFGYKIKGDLQWFCAEHRLSQNYADARQTPNPRVISVNATVCTSKKTRAAINRLSLSIPERPKGGSSADLLAWHAKAIKAAGTRVIADVIEIGRHLTNAKKLCGHGNWLPWLEKEFGWSDDTARNFMNVFSQIPNAFGI